MTAMFLSLAQKIFPVLVRFVSFDVCLYITPFIYSLVFRHSEPRWFFKALRAGADLFSKKEKTGTFIDDLKTLYVPFHAVFMVSAAAFLAFGIEWTLYADGNYAPYQYNIASIIIWGFYLFLGAFYYIPNHGGRPGKKAARQQEQALYDQAEQSLYSHRRAKAAPSPAPQRGSAQADANLRQLAEILGNIVTRLENTDRGAVLPSAKDDILEEAQKYFDASREDAAAWGPDFDYVGTAYTLLFHISFDLLASGRYHIGPGMLNPMHAGPNLRRFVSVSLDWAVDHGTITAEQKAEQLALLAQAISDAG